MLTLFTMPKPFRGHIGVIQRNAIQSWLRLRPACEVILMGDDEGTADVAAELGSRLIPRVARNEYSTPLLDSMFGEAEKAATYPHLCYVNADIILMSDFLVAVQQVVSEERHFLMVGQRWDLDVEEPLTFDSDWESKLRSRVEQEGQLHGHSGMDYFVYPRGFWGEIPPFAIGRRGWDNWLIYQARARRASLIDLTEMVMVVHQNHAYPQSIAKSKSTLDHPEIKRNVALTEGCAYAASLSAATHKLTRRGLVLKKRGPYELYRQLVILSVSYPLLKPIVRLLYLMGSRIRILFSYLVVAVRCHMRKHS